MPEAPKKPPVYIARIQYKDGSVDTWTCDAESTAKNIVTELKASMTEPFAAYNAGFVRSELIKHVYWYQKGAK